jgi:hypothetical protein
MFPSRDGVWDPGSALSGKVALPEKADVSFGIMLDAQRIQLGIDGINSRAI